MAIDTSSTTPQLQAASEFKRCLRERLRHAREVAALRARFATAVEDYERVVRMMQVLAPPLGIAVEDYERVVRMMQVLAPPLGIEESDVLHPTNPKWGPAALVSYADGHFLKKEQDAIDRLLHQLP